jgi:hypothetical protein
MPDEYLEFEDLDALIEELDRNAGVLTAAAWQVRDAYGADRLGAQVRANITMALRGRGVGHHPEAFPDRQYTLVRLYKLDSAAGRLVEAALTPGQGQDQTIREAGGDEAARLLSRVRELVCD